MIIKYWEYYNKVSLSALDISMAVECFHGTFPIQPDSTLPLPTERCTPEDGICYYSLSMGGGQATAQLGCWPTQSSVQLAWWGIPECKNEVERLICLCLETLCNGMIPTAKEIIPEGEDVQGLVMLVLILIPVVMIALAIYCMYKLKLTKNLNSDHNAQLENGEKEKYMQQEQGSFYVGHHSPRDYSYHLCPPSSPHSSQCSPVVPLIRMSSAPARLKRTSRCLDHAVGIDVKALDMGQGSKLEGGLLFYLDRSNTTTCSKTGKSGMKRLDSGRSALKGSHNHAFCITGPVVKPPGKVTAV